MSDVLLTNARIVLADEIISGTVLLRDGVIAEISETVSDRGIDCEGDYLIPGLVELHTDHLEQHYSPRPGVRWNMLSAVQSHDAQIAASGITTVFDCLRMGSDEDTGYDPGEMRGMADALEQAKREERLRISHLLHLRCEVSSENVLEHFADFAEDHQVRLVSLMDHAPGQRQFQTLEQYAKYYKGKKGMSDEAFARFVDRRVKESETFADPHRRALAAHCRERGIALASHDDATLAHVDEAIGFGIKLAEFPTSLEAAIASHKAGMSVLMGAPNIMRGGSHSGNIAATDLAAHGVLDVLSSDYVPFSLIQAPFRLVRDREDLSLPQAIAMVTSTPARTVGLDDRGVIEVGKRADLVLVREDGSVPVVRCVWHEGHRVI